MAVKQTANASLSCGFAQGGALSDCTGVGGRAEETNMDWTSQPTLADDHVFAGLRSRMTCVARSSTRRLCHGALLVGIALLLSGCGINTIPTLEEQAKAAWSQVQNQYQRRADLIPNLVETVKGFAQQEREVLTQ